MVRLSKSWLGFLIPALLLFCLPGGALAGDAAPVLRLSVDQDHHEVGHYLEILEDPEGGWTIEKVSSPPLARSFSPVNSPSVNLGITRTTVWLRFSIKGYGQKEPRGLHPAPWMLDLGLPIFDSVDAFVVRPAAAGRERISNITSAATRDAYQTGNAEKAGAVVRLPELSPEGQDVYLRLQADGVFFLYPTVRTVKDYLESSTRRMLWFGIYFGVLAALLLYNLFLYFGLRERSYLWYVISIAAVGFYFFFFNRLTYEYLVDFRPVDMVRVIIGFTALAMMGLVQFARCFLQTWDNVPRLDRLIRIYFGVLFGLMVLMPFAGITFLNECFTIMGALTWLLLIPAALICWRNGYRPARFLVLSWIFYGGGTLVYFLTFRGIISYSNLGFHSLQIGSALEAVLLSFALADRINLLRQEREELSRSERRHRELAITDALTGLYNLRYFRAQIDLEVELADRLGQNLTLMMLDVDYFKVFNDRYGHPEGDRVLCTLGQVLTSCVRERDIACRYGGEEFALILPGGRNLTAMEIYQRINAELALERFGPEGVEGLVTLSTGVAEHIPGERAETLLHRADKALYEAKARGRNQIVVAGSKPDASFFSCITEPSTDDRFRPHAG